MLILLIVALFLLFYCLFFSFIKSVLFFHPSCITSFVLANNVNYLCKWYVLNKKKSKLTCKPIFRSKKKTLLAKNCDLGLKNPAFACRLGQHFQDFGHRFSLHGPPRRQIAFIYYMASGLERKRSVLIGSLTCNGKAKHTVKKGLLKFIPDNPFSPLNQSASHWHVCVLICFTLKR